MFDFRVSLTLIIPLAILGSASAKVLTEKQTRAAAARIDQLIAEDLKEAKLRPTGRIDDGTFLRRSYLAIIGRIPTEQEARKFFDDPSSDKRNTLIETLTASPGFDSHLFNWTADLLRVQTGQEQFGLGWHVWLRQSLSNNKPWDEIVEEMLSASGHAAENPAVGYYLRDRNMPLDNFSNSMQVFLGRQIGCAQCHDHPFDDWSQLDYYQMAAFGGGFSYRSEQSRETKSRVVKELQPKQKAAPKGLSAKQKKEHFRKLRAQRQKKNREFFRGINILFKDFDKNALTDNAEQVLRLPEDYQYQDAQPNEAVQPETLFGERLKNVDPEKRRQVFAQWVTSENNPYFTKVIANRLWDRTFGRGLVDPVDDWNENTRSAHPEVLAFLETTMKAVDYDLRQFSRILFHTSLFQRECDPVEPVAGTRHIVRGPALQRMTAEQLFDSMIVLTRGEITDTPSPTHANKWVAYTKAVDNLVSKPSSDLMAMGQAAREADSKYREHQLKVRSLQAQASKASSPPKRRELYAAAAEERQMMTHYRRLSDPLSMNGMAMTMMGGEENKKRRSGPVRASEMSAPFKPGTLVREFGGSDRASPSSGEEIATVPQALALLNDAKTDIFISSKKSSFTRKLLSLDNPEERLEMIFLRIYSRMPDKRDIDSFLPLAKDDTALRDLTRAMMTSSRFIFIQ
ncbi:MAG: DUF1549 domain-containing protein [Akkermansiaceae bacterium]